MVARALLPPWVTVFMVHRVAPAGSGITGTDPEYLRSCLTYLKRHRYHLIAIDDALELILSGEGVPKNSVAFTLDDGFDDQVTTAAEIFQEFSCPATTFLVTGMIDRQLWPWDYQLMFVAQHAKPQTISIEVGGTLHTLQMGVPQTKQALLKFVRQVSPQLAYETAGKIAQAAGITLPSELPPAMRPATWDQVRAAEDMGMRFGAHSASHHILSKLDDATLREEMMQSVQRIREECRKPSSLFCYPSGKADEFDRRSMDWVKELGLIGALSAEPGYLEPGKIRVHPRYRYAVPRLPLPKSMSEFRLYVSWAQYLREHFSDSELETLYFE